MRILHLFSNWKWTGPAEPALNLCLQLQERHETTFILGGHPRTLQTNDVAREAKARGIDPVLGFHLEKHFHALHNIEDIMKLRSFLQERAFDLIHTHMTNDHFVTACALRTLRQRPPIVRTFYDGEGMTRSMRTRWLLRHFTDTAVVISDHARRELLAKKVLSPERIAVIPGGIDTDRFDPATIDRAATRRAFGFGDDDFVFGIVARMQRHRRFELLIEAFKQAQASEPDLRLVIVGRGTHQDEVARRPVQENGLDGKVVFAGYRQGRDFVAALGAMDCSIFLIPGSDGSCRAVREKMAMGLPVISSRNPPLDEMIDHERTGLLVDLERPQLTAALLRMARTREQAAAMGRQARAKALADYSLTVQAERVDTCYRRLAEARA